MDLRPCRKIGNCSCGMAQFLLWHRSKQPPWIGTHPGQVIFLDSSKSPGDIRSSETLLDAVLRVSQISVRETHASRRVSTRHARVRTPHPQVQFSCPYILLSERCWA